MGGLGVMVRGGGERRFGFSLGDLVGLFAVVLFADVLADGGVEGKRENGRYIFQLTASKSRQRQSGAKLTQACAPPTRRYGPQLQPSLSFIQPPGTYL